MHEQLANFPGDRWICSHILIELVELRRLVCVVDFYEQPIVNSRGFENSGGHHEKVAGNTVRNGCIVVMCWRAASNCTEREEYCTIKARSAWAGKACAFSSVSFGRNSQGNTGKYSSLRYFCKRESDVSLCERNEHFPRNSASFPLSRKRFHFL